ncbi:hypothetical protein LCGC14_1170540 [marine sediment metagenome]|uniref:Uncharacterized protein n=1 Tax=marine sediment metagenome TaxID=412755 RepID=A0A0F9PVH7_9ZZZZ
MQSAVEDILFGIGLSSVIYGVSMISIPWAWIVGGSISICIAVLLLRSHGHAEGAIV